MLALIQSGYGFSVFPSYRRWRMTIITVHNNENWRQDIRRGDTYSNSALIALRDEVRFLADETNFIDYLLWPVVQSIIVTIKSECEVRFQFSFRNKVIRFSVTGRADELQFLREVVSRGSEAVQKLLVMAVAGVTQDYIETALRTDSVADLICAIRMQRWDCYDLDFALSMATKPSSISSSPTR